MNYMRDPAPLKWAPHKGLGLLSHGIGPSDIDLVYERRGWLLIAECKRPGEEMKDGQRRLLDHLSRQPHVRVCHIIGHPPDDIQAFGRWGEAPGLGDAEGWHAFVDAWIAAVDRLP